MNHGFGNDDFKIKLKILYWNINGFTEMIKTEEVSNWLYKNCDICFLSETHMTMGQKFDVNNFKCVNHPFSDVFSKKPRGGLICMVKFEIVQYITKINCDTPDHIVVDFHGGHKIFSSYIPPSDSLYYDDTCFTGIPNTFHHNDDSRVIIGGGDLNCRIGDITQNVPILGASYRPNIDTEVNVHGKMLRNICRSYNCYVLNNLTINNLNFDGDFTFFRGERRSQNDLILANLAGLRKTSDFSIHRIGWNFSDHLPVSVTVSLNLYDAFIPSAASSDILSDLSTKLRVRQRKIVSENVDWEAYRVIANRELRMLEDKMNVLVSEPNTEHLNTVIDSLSKSLYNAAKTCESKPENIATPSLDATTPAMAHANETLVRYGSGLCSWEECHDARNEAVLEIREKYYAKEINSWRKTLQNSDSKELWSKIDWKGYSGSVDIFDHSPEIEDLVTQFKSKDSDLDEKVIDVDFGAHRVPILDEKLTLEELDAASKRIKEGKSTADGWVPKMMNEVKLVLFPLLLVLFNIILQESIFPQQWLFCVVVALFKNKGSRWLAKYFRPVSLVIMLSKLFDFLLLGRFKIWFTPNDLQTAYQDGKSASDHIFLMRCLIQQFIRDKRKLFITAIDFDGAFDRVNRRTLLKKLLICGASALFVRCLANMYSLSGNIIYSNGSSILYMLHSGIKQGLPLSPYLFLFYIDDIFEYLDNTIQSKFDVFENLHILIHADDANVMACSKDRMIQKLKSVLQYCKINSVVLQASKCFFTVLNSTMADKQPLLITSNDSVEFRDHLEILGSHISDSLKKDLELHYKKRFKNVIKFFNYVKSNRLAPVSVKLKVLKACMSALLHNCEAFGPKIPEGLDLMYFKMMRAALGVRSNVSKLTLMVESGCLPLDCLIRSRQLKFYRRFKDSVKGKSIRDKIFQELLNNKSDFLKHYTDLDKSYISSDDLKAEQIKLVHTKIRNLAADKDKHYKYWVYLQLNPELKPSPFLGRIDKVGKAMTKFRLGSHKLKIETGRWSRVPRDERLCGTCNVLGDERHCIYDCVEIPRGDLDLPMDLPSIWSYAKVNVLFKRIIHAEYLE